MTQKQNEAFIRQILENLSQDDAIAKIASAITNRDEKIDLLEKQLTNS